MTRCSEYKVENYLIVRSALLLIRVIKFLMHLSNSITLHISTISGTYPIPTIGKNTKNSRKIAILVGGSLHYPFCEVSEFSLFQLHGVDGNPGGIGWTRTGTQPGPRLNHRITYPLGNGLNGVFPFAPAISFALWTRNVPCSDSCEVNIWQLSHWKLEGSMSKAPFSFHGGWNWLKLNMIFFPCLEVSLTLWSFL